MGLEKQLAGRPSPAIRGHHITTDALYGEFVPNSAFRDLIAQLDLTSISDLTDDDTSVRRAPQHTNEILDYFGFRDGFTRAKILSDLNGNYQYGAEIIRATYHVVKYFGLEGSYENTSSQTQNIFLAVAKLIHQNDVQTASLIINGLGFEHIPEIVGSIKDYTILQIGSEMSLVSRRHLERIIKKRDTFMLSSPRGPLLMHELGYEPLDLNGVVMYVHRRVNGGGSYIH